MEEEKITKAEKRKARRDAKKDLKAVGGKLGGLWAEFKAFISKGSVLDMAIGVVIGAAFSAIITAVVNGVIMPLVTLAVPAGIDGLVTVLNPTAALPKDTTTNFVTYWGTQYDADVVNIMNWGTLINAVLYFFIVALILFVILKVATTLKASREKLAAMQLEKHYQKHPEDRPVVKEEVKGPTQEELLQQILDELKAKKK